MGKRKQVNKPKQVSKPKKNETTTSKIKPKVELVDSEILLNELIEENGSLRREINSYKYRYLKLKKR